MDININSVPDAELPEVIGALSQALAEAHLRLRNPSPSAPERLLLPSEAASIAQCSPRWLLRETRGHRCRADQGRRQPRFIESRLMGWLTNRKARP